MAGEESKKATHRSPNYPAINLADAVYRVKLLYDKDRKAGAPIDIALKHLGYSSRNGAALRVLAALKTFGLTEEKDGRIFVSSSALDVLVYPETDERRKRPLRECALKPATYQKVYDRYKDGLPSDETVKAELIREFGFNDKVVEGFLNDFKATLDFAGVKFGDSAQDATQDTEQSVHPVTRIMTAHGESRSQSHAQGVGVGMNSDTFTLDEGQVVLQWPAKMSPESYGDFKDWLDLIARKIKRSSVKSNAGEEGGSDEA
jgi:hypothetical protein